MGYPCPGKTRQWQAQAGGETTRTGKWLRTPLRCVLRHFPIPFLHPGGSTLNERYRVSFARALIRVSQYLIRWVIYEGPQEPRELFFRILLFKLFNRIETWELLQREAGPLHTDAFCVERYDGVLLAALTLGVPIYSAAYIMPSGGKGAPFARKHRMHLELLARMLRDELPERLAGMATMAQAFAALRTYPTIGDFLAYQYVTDLNYSTLTNFSEAEFVVPGPGRVVGHPQVLC